MLVQLFLAVPAVLSPPTPEIERERKSIEYLIAIKRKPQVGIFTLILSALLKIERFSWTKLLSVLLSLAGISLISSIDFDTPEESTIPGNNAKTPAKILLGDGMALIGALSYGVYTTLLKARVGHESRVSMQMFFGFVGLFNLLGLWPGLVLLHITGVEKFELPPDNRVWWIVAVSTPLSPPLAHVTEYHRSTHS